MKTRQSRLRTSLGSALAVMPLVLCSLAAVRSARAADPLGLYVGAAYGQAHVRAQPGRFTSGRNSPFPLPTFDAAHSAYQAMLGIRLLSFIGAEVTYMDFGRPSPGQGIPGPGANATAEQASQKGEAAYALLYLPVPIIDVYVKAGISRIKTDINASYALPGVGTCTITQPDCGVIFARGSSTDTAFAYGAGLQWKLGHWAVRGEYERFSAAGEHPTLASIGMLYWFL